MISLSWPYFKAFVDLKLVSIQFFDLDASTYILYAFDGPMGVQCVLAKGTDETTDFETNYKTSGNRSVIANTVAQQMPSYGSKTLISNGVTKSLFARNTGIRATVNNGSNTINYTATYTWTKMIGMQCIGAVAGDYASLQVYDNSSGTYSGVPNALLNQFGYTLNLAAGFYERSSPFDADVFVGMILKITYVSTSILPNNIGINILMNEVK